ncbi:hypothetical protein B0H19DRAFT_1064515 [Mycena capillaripes]|nr:hypothetical protein B0H19DRAFT_1064515 [Mycena capillaripes]
MDTSLTQEMCSRFSFLEDVHVTDFYNRLLQNYCHILGIYAEIRFIWRRRKTTSAYWFLVNRYLGFISNIPVAILPFATLSPRVCTQATIMRQVLLLATQVVVSCRPQVYVLCPSSPWAGSDHDLESLRSVRLQFKGGVALNLDWGMRDSCYCVVNARSKIFSRIFERMSCRNNAIYHNPELYVGLAAAWEGLFILDSTIFGFTVFNAYNIIRRMGPLGNMPIHRIIVRDVTMVSRLMLNLHEHADIGILTDLNASVLRNDEPLDDFAAGNNMGPEAVSGPVDSPNV